MAAQWLRIAQTPMRARRNSAGTAGRARLRGQRQGPHDRFPRLRLHAHAVGDFRRADDALRRDASRRSGSCRCATTSQPVLSVAAPQGRLPGAGRARGVGRREAASSTASTTARSTAPCRHAAVEAFRADKADVRRAARSKATSASTLDGAWKPEAQRRRRRRAVRADRAAQGAAGDGAAGTAGAGCAARHGASSTTHFERRNTWRPTSPRTWRARCWRRIRR